MSRPRLLGGSAKMEGHHPAVPYLPAVVLMALLSLGAAFVDVCPPRMATPRGPRNTACEAERGSPSTALCASSTFDLEKALFCAGLAFDAYVEPPANSSRWERGSKGLNVAFCSNAFTRNLYKGLVEVRLEEISGLPDEDDLKESVLTGGGVDACLLVAAVEGNWKQDVDLITKQEYHSGVLDLSSAAHVGRSPTAWANVNEQQSASQKKKNPTSPRKPYHVPKAWGRNAKAVWPEVEPFYLYIQDPASARLVFTVLDDDVVGEGSAIGSTHKKLTDFFPQASFTQGDMIESVKQKVLSRIQQGTLSLSEGDEEGQLDREVSKLVSQELQEYHGTLKLTNKPRIEDKKGQVATAAAAGALLGGPAGAAVGALAGSLYEGQVQGRIQLSLRYLPIPATVEARKVYTVNGGLPGVTWGKLYSSFLKRQSGISNDMELANVHISGSDLEHCFFINHDVTGSCCAVYRSLEKKLLVVSFRGTCAPVDLLTDASIVQDPWVEGEKDNGDDEIAKVHVGFRKSLNSISRRLKELLLASVAPGEDISEYDMIVTGHSLGAALGTLFAADIAEFGIDAGRGLPQTADSDAWWKFIQNTFMGQQGLQGKGAQEPPRPKSLSLYNYGSPRVGNREFAKRFESLCEQGRINEAYRIVNDKDVVARLPRTMYTLGVNYDHCGSTVLVVEPTQENADPVIWIEGESDQNDCPVRDYEERIANPLGAGTLLGDLFQTTQEALQGGYEQDTTVFLNKIGQVANKVGARLKTVTATDVAGVFGLNSKFTEREIQLIGSLFEGTALAHHMEDKYYAALGRAGGFVALVGKDIVPVTNESVLALETEAEAQEKDQGRIASLSEEASALLT